MFDIDLHHPVLRTDEVSRGILWSVVNSEYHACHCFTSLNMDTKYVHDSQLQFKPLQFFVCFFVLAFCFLLSDWSFLSLDHVGIQTFNQNYEAQRNRGTGGDKTMAAAKQKAVPLLLNYDADVK
jgi:hypothetical protein